MISIISWLFLLYFVVLYAERIQSLVRLFFDSKIRVFGNGFDTYVNLASMLSLASGIVLLAFFNAGFWASLFSSSAVVDYSMLCITSGVILVSGMVHTEYTIAPVQFASYGSLIVAMALMTIVNVKHGSAAFGSWYSFVYLTLFSMAIPVMYKSQIDKACLFHALEAVVSLVLVACFTIMLRLLFLGQGENLLLWVPIVIAVLGDAALLAMRWKEEVNTFVLIFIIASVAAFVVGKVLFAVI